MYNNARLVIIGAGIVGCGAAYHLTKMGWRDVLVLDKGNLFENDGSTSHAPGGAHVTNFSKMMTNLALQSVELYATLKPFADNRPVYRPVGGLEVAYTKERWTDLKRKHGAASSYGVETYLLSPKETQAHIPILNPNIIKGSYYVPKDTNVIGWHVSGSLARAAEATGGATFVSNTSVVDIEVTQGRITAVLTNNPNLPRIECEQALLCANIWAPPISQKMGVPLPLLAAEHQYAISTPLPELAHYAKENENREIVHPILRHQDFSMYFRQHWDCYGIGNYRHEPRMVKPRDLKKTAMKPFTPKDFKIAWQAAGELLPPLKNAELTTKFNGMFAFTIDGYPILGESLVKGLWTAVGVWITHAGGVSKAVAEWMTHGEAELDLREANINRFLPYQCTQTYIDLRCAQNYREVYDIIHPAMPISAPRNVRLTPFHTRLQELEAHFVPSAGYEMAQWYEGNAPLLEKYKDRIPQRDGWAAQHWSPIQGIEHLALRESVGLIDLTALAIVEVKGKGALTFLNHLAANQINRPVGKIIYSTLLTPRGGIKRDLTIARLAKDRFWILTGGGYLPQDLSWIRQHAPANGSVQINDISTRYTALGLWGPNARKVLQKVTQTDVSNQQFPYYTWQRLEIGAIPVLAMRLSYAGELGWEIYIPTESGLCVWDSLWEAGQAFNLIVAGMGAFESLRLEKGYRLWGTDIHTEYNPYEANLGWSVKLKKGDFIGREALLKLKAKGIKQKLCCLTLDDSQAVLLGKEPIFNNEHCLGYVCSANFGYSVGKFIAYGYLPLNYAKLGTKLEVEYFGKRFGATVSDEPLFDPKMNRLKSIE